MARGWESKDVESQQELAEQRKLEQRAAKSAEEVERESLQLHRKRVLADLERARHDRHRAQLQEALRHLDERLKLLGAIPTAGAVPEPDGSKDDQ